MSAASIPNVLVVGAGPSGAAAALRLAARGVDGVLLVDKHDFPRDKTCGSALSPGALTALDELGVGDSVRRDGHPLRALRIVTPAGRQVRLTTSEGVAFPRRELDHRIVAAAGRLGATFRGGVQVTGLVEEDGRVVGVRARGGEILRARRVLAADGAHSVLSRDPRPRRTIATAMGWWEGADAEPATMEMVFDRELAPLYGWLIPEAPGRVNVGVCVDGEDGGGRKAVRGLHQLLERFVARHFAARLAGARRVGRVKGHPISFTTWIGHCAAPGILYLGEAARMAHNLTGEGIHHALRSGIEAADAVVEVERGACTEAEAWRHYAWRCRRRFTLGFAAGRLGRTPLVRQLCEVAAATYDSRLVRRLNTWGAEAALADTLA